MGEGEGLSGVGFFSSPLVEEDEGGGYLLTVPPIPTFPHQGGRGEKAVKNRST